MSPLPPEDPVTLPKWVLQFVIAPIAVGFTSLMWWLGQKIIQDWEEAADTRDEKIRELRGEIRDQREEIRALKRDLAKQMQGDHSAVESKLDKLLDKVQ